MTIHVIRRTATITTTTTTEEIAESRLSKAQQQIYNAYPSPYGNPLRELERKIARVARRDGTSLEEATHAVLHFNVN